MSESDSESKQQKQTIRNPRLVRKVCVTAFLAGWAVTGPVLASVQVHWLNSLYLSLVLTPFLTCIILRAIKLKRHGWHFLSWQEARSHYGWPILATFTTIVLLYSLEHWRGARAFERLRQSVEASGGSLELSSLAPAPIADDKNLCETPLLRALIQGNHDANLALGDYRDITPSEDLTRIQKIEPPARPPLERPLWFSNQTTDFNYWTRPSKSQRRTNQQETSTTNPASQLLSDLEPYSLTLEELAKESKARPKGRWNLPYERGWMIEALVGARDQAISYLVTVLSLRSSAFLAIGDRDAAAQDLLLGFRLAESLEGSPSFYIHIRRMDFLLTLIQPFWEGLALHRWSTDQLETFYTALTKVDLLRDSVRLRKGAALAQIDLWDQVDEAYSLKTLINHFGQLADRDDGARLWVTLLWQLHPKGWSYQSKVFTYEYFFPDSELKKPRIPVNPVCSLFVLPKLKAIEFELEDHFPTANIAIQEALLAIELEKYYLTAGHYPDSLDLLPKERQERSHLIDYHPGPVDRYLLSPQSNPSPSEVFQRNDNQQIVRVGSGYWDLVWRYPKIENENRE